ncbi:21671_t:CDS:1, partial [Gigaspora margarita]
PELDDEDDNISQASFSTQSTASTFASGTSKRLRTNSEKNTKVQSTINQYIGRNLLSNEIDTFFKLLLHMTISNGWAFQWIENQEIIEFFNFISPLLELPSRKTLADKILKNLAESIQNNIEVATKEDKYSIFVSLDGWKNVVKQNILGLVITRSDGQVLIWGAKDISEDRGNTNAAIKHISAFLNKTQSKNIKINTVITDSASSYNAAR